MSERPSPAHRPARSPGMTRDEAAMLVVTISVCTILASMGILGIMVLPGEMAEPDPEPAVPAVEPTASASPEPEQALEYSTTEEVDPASLEGVAALWYEASINNNLATVEPHTCANPSPAVTESLSYNAAHDVTDNDYTVSYIYVTSREHDGIHQVAIFLLANEPTYDYVWEKEARSGDRITYMTLVEEDGEWKVCGLAYA